MSKKNSKRRVWRGVTTATASLLALSVCASTVVDGFRTDIDKFLGTKSTKLVTEDTDGVDLYTFKSDYTSTTDLLHGIQDVGERMSEEGSVLLKNNGALPLTKDETQKITLLGFSSYYPVQGGDMGSSFVENTGTDADTVDMVQAFKAKGFSMNQTVADMYEALQPTFKSEVQSWGGTIEYNHITAPSTTGVFSSKEPSQAALDGQNAAWKDSMNDNNVMIVTIARSASENGTYQPGTAGVDPTQNLNQTDPLGLSDDERDLINAAVTAKASNGGKVIVLLNNASAMEVQEIQDNDGVDAILQVGLPGGYGFYGVADILSGEVNPSGHLTDTYAVKNANSPAAQNFGDLQWTNANPDIQMNDAIVEAENIYIGYKYYETRYFDTVMNQGNAASTVGSSTGSAWNYDDEVTYPFGYGLSYTSFDWDITDATANGSTLTKDGDVTVKVTVTNTGDRAGKDVVQLYYTAPYITGEIEKSSVELGTFAKTKELQPGESEEVTLTVPVEKMASYDAYDANHNGFAGYELDAGEYIFTARHDAHTVDDAEKATLTCTLPANVQYPTDSVSGNEVGNKFTGSDAIDGVSLDGSDSAQNITYLTRADFAGTFPKACTPSRAMTDNVKALNLYTADMANGYINEADEAITTGAKNGLKIEDNGKTTELGYQLGADFNDPQWDALLDQLTVDEMENLFVNGYGGLVELKSVGKARSKDADGPAQIGGFTGMGAGTGFPSSSTLAQTWNADLALQEGRTIGTQALQNGYTGWYAPATNMHRSPFNGRNYEYYSEDSLLSGVICGNTVQGANDAGVYTYVKHFICNDGESGIYRDSVYTWMTEQTLRETYLRPFRMLVEEYDAVGLMSSYNRIGAVWAGGSEALLTGILRDEWGFDGAVITDYADHHSFMNGDQALRAGGSLWMSGMMGGQLTCETGSNSYMQALRRAAKETLYMYLHVRVTNRDYAESIGDTAALRHDFKPAVLGWRHLVALIDLVAVALFALAIRGIVRDVKLYKAAKAGRTENKNA